MFLAPAAPSNLEVESAGLSWVVISWQQNSGRQEIVQQKIFIVGGSETRMIVVSGIEMMFNITELEPGTEYTFTITSEGADGQSSPQSESLMITIPIPGAVLFKHVPGICIHAPIQFKCMLPPMHSCST